MNNKRLWTRLLGVEGAVVEEVEWEAEVGVIVRVRVGWRHRSRCPHCGRRSPREDNGDGWRRWRSLDLGLSRVWVEAQAPRVRCREHGIVVAAHPWARHASRFTRGFEDQVAWLVTQMSRSAVAELMRISWRSVERIMQRVVAEGRARTDLLEGLRSIGIDEVSYKKGHRYLMIVVDHERDRLVWAAEGRNAATVSAFFDALGPRRCAELEFVSADGALYGYATAKSSHIFRDFVDAVGHVTLTDKQVVVRFQKRAHNPLLLAAGFADRHPTVPWLGGRRLHLVFG